MVSTADGVPEFLAAWGAAEWGGDVAALDDLQVRSRGSTTVVIARQTAQGDDRGKPSPEGMRATLLVDSGHGGPQLAGVHLSFLAGTPGASPLPGGPAQPGATRG